MIRMNGSECLDRHHAFAGMCICEYYITYDVLNNRRDYLINYLFSPCGLYVCVYVWVCVYECEYVCIREWEM